jgi:hypothetical protein
MLLIILLDIHYWKLYIQLLLLSEVALPLCLGDGLGLAWTAIFISQLFNRRRFWVVLFGLVQPILNDILVVLVNVDLLSLQQAHGRLVKLYMLNKIVGNPERVTKIFPIRRDFDSLHFAIFI